jgi:LemA family
MRTGLVVLAVVVVLLVGLVMWGIGVQNQLVRLEQDVNEKWAQVQNVYQRRADLIPNLVETVRGFAQQERTVLTEVTQARANATSIQGAQPAARHRRALSGAEIEPELPHAAKPARGHGEPRHHRAAALQHLRPRIQHAVAHVSRQSRRRGHGLQAQGLLRGGAGQ